MVRSASRPALRSSLLVLTAVAFLAGLALLAPDASARVSKLKEGESVNINKAGYKELVKLKGVGKATAKRILEYRDANGDFSSVGELTKVRGIGKKTIAKLRPFLRVEGEVFIGKAKTGNEGMEEETPSEEKPPEIPKDESSGKNDVEIL
jgi:comEA protein